MDRTHESGMRGGPDDPSKAPPTPEADIFDPFTELGDPDSLDELEEQIVVLASHIHAATYRFLVLVAEFERRGGWKRAGHRSCADWLHFRTGIARSAAREKVRTARALARLPLTSQAMARGELSFSKVRAITRLVDDVQAAPVEDEGVASAGGIGAVPADGAEDLRPTEAEAELVDCARQVTAADLEKVVRRWHLTGRHDEAEIERRRHRLRYVSVAPDGEGMYVLRGKLDPEVGALVMRAIEAASDALFRAGEDWAPVGGPRGPRSEEVTPRHRRADALGLLAERAMAAGFGNVGGKAGDGTAESRTQEAESPREEAESPRGDGSASGDGEAPHSCPCSTTPLSGTRAERYQVFLHVDPATLREDGPGGRSNLEDGTRVSAETARRLTCDAAVVEVGRGDDGAVLDVGRKTRTIPPALRRALEIRDGGCKFPGCGLRFTEGHHIMHWVDGGETNLKNLVLLCRRHHRAVHEEGFRLRRMSDDTVRFFDRTGWPLPDGPPLSRLAPGAVDRLLEANRRRGVRPDAYTPSATYKRTSDIPFQMEARLREVFDPA